MIINIVGGHALVHYKVPRSDLHCICVNVTTSPMDNRVPEEPSRWDIFCYEVNIRMPTM